MRHARSLLLALMWGCAPGAARPAQAPAPAPPSSVAPSPSATAEASSVTRPQYRSTYRRHPNPPVLIRNATIMTAAGQEIAGGSIFLKDGRIVAVGTKIDAVIDFAADPVMGPDQAACDQTLYLPDGIHPTYGAAGGVGGQGKLELIYAPVVDRLLSS